jgi:hypothetical protein
MAPRYQTKTILKKVQNVKDDIAQACAEGTDLAREKRIS